MAVTMTRSSAQPKEIGIPRPPGCGDQTEKYIRPSKCLENWGNVPMVIMILFF